MMAVNSLFSPRPWSEEGFGFPRSLGEEAHVLAVDDSIVDRKVIEKLLKIYSCKVTAVDSVKRALQFLGLDEEVTEKNSVVEGLKVDLIITDYSMPELTGYELLKKIKESSAFREIPVVIMSSENVLARIDRCLEEGAEDFIVKPVKLSDMERLKEHFAAKDVSKSKDRALSNKRKQPYAPDLTASPTSSESPPSITSQSSESPASSPSSESLASSPSSESPASSPSSESPASSPSSESLASSPSSESLASSLWSESLASSPSAPLSSAASPLLPPLSPDLPPPVSEPLDSPSIKLKSTSSSDVILSDSPLWT